MTRTANNEQPFLFTTHPITERVFFFTDFSGIKPRRLVSQLKISSRRTKSVRVLSCIYCYYFFHRKNITEPALRCISRVRGSTRSRNKTFRSRRKKNYWEQKKYGNLTAAMAMLEDAGGTIKKKRTGKERSRV